jgi:PmbA protein
MSFLKNDLGNQIFPANVNIIDDPTIIRGLASRPFDAEAIGGNKRLIVENGVLKSWLLDLRSARQLNMETTASAYRSIASSPHAGTSNFYLNNGSLSKDALLKTVKKALYVTNLMGMGVNAITGDYSQGASGFYIENGEIIHPVNEVTIASNLKHMFANMVMADDLTMLYSINSPTILIEEMILAGV